MLLLSPMAAMGRRGPLLLLLLLLPVLGALLHSRDAAANAPGEGARRVTRATWASDAVGSFEGIAVLFLLLDNYAVQVHNARVMQACQHSSLIEQLQYTSIHRQQRNKFTLRHLHMQSRLHVSGRYLAYTVYLKYQGRQQQTFTHQLQAPTPAHRFQ
jgi:hypothetical protein